VYLIEKYQRNEDSNCRLKEKYGKGSAIMHVILTFLTDNQRVEEQALGKRAWNGKNGSGIIIMKSNLIIFCSRMKMEMKLKWIKLLILYLCKIWKKNGVYGWKNMD